MGMLGSLCHAKYRLSLMLVILYVTLCVRLLPLNSLIHGGTDGWLLVALPITLSKIFVKYFEKLSYVCFVFSDIYITLICVLVQVK